MGLFLLDEKIWFPPVEDAMEDGLLAFGGDLSVERLLLGYQQGIFPWFDGGVPLWWSPDPRCVLFPQDLKVSHSMKPLLKRNAFDFSIDTHFREVIVNCQLAKRRGDPGTWITEEIVDSYCRLFELGHAHCAAAWKNGKMAGGLYGVKINNVFCGESMFSNEPNASKYAFIRYVEYLASTGVKLIDCQINNPHLESLGATMIPRTTFLSYLLHDQSA